MGAVRWLPAFLAFLPFLAWMAGTAEAAGSVGCGRPPPWSVPDHVVLEGRKRGLIADLPADYDSFRPHRLVVAFHGRTNDNAPGRDYYGLGKTAGGGPRPPDPAPPAGRPIQARNGRKAKKAGSQRTAPMGRLLR